MVQNANMTQNQFGMINRAGMTQDGRAVYQVTSSDGRQSVSVSIPTQDCDRFERAYSDMITAAPKLEQYMQEHSSPEDAKKIKRRTGWLIGGSTAVGLVVTSLLTKKLKPLLRWTTTIAGTIAGFVAGAAIAGKVNTPPGAKEFENAAKTLSEIDVQPLK